MTRESLDILSNTPVGETVEVEGRMIRVENTCRGCIFFSDCCIQPDAECRYYQRDENADVRYVDVTPWQNWPDARRDGMCEIPVTVARTLRTVIDNITGSQVLEAGLNANHLIEARIFLDNALNGAKKADNA